MNYGIHIDAKNNQAVVVEFENGFKGMKQHLGIDLAEAIDLGGGVTMWCDEEGRLKSDQVWFKFNGNLIAGSAMVVFGNYVLPFRVDAEKVRDLLEFVDAEILTINETEPDIGFIGSKAELDAAIASGKVPAHLVDFFA